MMQRALIPVLLICILMPATLMSKEVKRVSHLTIFSPSFAHKAEIPQRYTCDGRDITPPLTIDSAPAGTQSLALIMFDPDAPVGIWTHWVLWNIPPNTRELKENQLPAGAIQGTNSWKRTGYGGPCPPSGSHRYFFMLYALDTTLKLAPGTTKADLERAMEGHIIARAELMGTYRRR